MSISQYFQSHPELSAQLETARESFSKQSENLSFTAFVLNQKIVDEEDYRIWAQVQFSLVILNNDYFQLNRPDSAFLSRWKDTYAITNVSEYWAEAVQSYLDCNQPKINASHNGVFSRERLRAHDPEVFRLIEESLKISWRWTPLEKRPARERKHLRGYDPKTAPTFRW